MKNVNISKEPGPGQYLAESTGRKQVKRFRINQAIFGSTERRFAQLTALVRWMIE
jgi:hypothetical protein